MQSTTKTGRGHQGLAGAQRFAVAGGLLSATFLVFVLYVNWDRRVCNRQHAMLHGISFEFKRQAAENQQKMRNCILQPTLDLELQRDNAQGPSAESLNEAWSDFRQFAPVLSAALEGEFQLAFRSNRELALLAKECVERQVANNRSQSTLTFEVPESTSSGDSSTMSRLASRVRSESALIQSLLESTNRMDDAARSVQQRHTVKLLVTLMVVAFVSVAFIVATAFWVRRRDSRTYQQNSKSMQALQDLVQLEMDERKRCEQDIRGIREVIENGVGETYLVDLKSLNVVLASRPALQRSGRVPHELLGLPMEQLIAAESRLDWLKQVTAIRSGNSRSGNGNFMMTSADGKSYPARIGMHCGKWLGNEVLALTVQDVSENDAIQRRLAVMNTAATVQQLASGIIHDMSSPMQCAAENLVFIKDCSVKLLAVVDGFEAEISSNAPPSERTANATILKKTYRIDQIRSELPLAMHETQQGMEQVTQLVRAMNETAHPGNTPPQPVNLNQLINTAITVTKSKWRHVAAVKLGIEEDLPAVLAVPSELIQIFTNLIANAADSIAEKQATNHASSEMGLIEIRARQDQDNVRIEFKDSGMGIPEYTIHRIFEPFYTTKAAGKGTGQGLAVVRDLIVKKYKGTISVQSEPGLGSRFVIGLLAHTAKTAPFMDAQGNSASVTVPLSESSIASLETR